MKEKDIRNDIFWNRLNGKIFKECIKRKRKFTGRFRFCSRGEPFMNVIDVNRMRDILIENQNILFWIPTRSWRNEELRSEIQNKILPLENNRIIMSIDPSNSEEEIEKLKKDGFSTMYFGDDEKTENRIKCPKTWYNVHGYCNVCPIGCFSDKRVDVHLKMH